MSDMPSAPASLESLMSSVSPVEVNMDAAPKEVSHTVHQADEELIEEMRLRQRASMTAFATGDMDRDVRLYKVMKEMSRTITGILGE